LGYSTQGHLEKAKVMRNISNNAESDYIVEFEDKKIKQICVDNWDISGDGEVSEYELSLVKDLNGVFTNFDHHDGYERFDNTFWELSYFTGLTSINDNEFGNSSIWAVSIPENVTRIGDNAFQRLYSVYIPKNVNSIGYKAFGSVEYIKVDPDNKWYDSRNDCNALIETATNTLVLGCENTVIPEGVKIIGDEAMSFCQYYSNTLSIPEGVTSIGREAFSGVLFSSVTIPKSVKEIKSKAFSFCDFLESFTVNWIHPIDIDDDVFMSWSHNQIYEDCTLYVPRGTKAAYQAAKGWKNFLKIEEVGKLVGDVNGDDIVNIVDVITTVNYILGNGEDTFDETVADMNDDGNVNIVDVTLIVNAILGK
ncbi:MAG: leucine-rich repeat protein, partial [Prevotella sp.]|nr:leucine-rich repeat protein [Prevotella sp.]